jgi:hypothetical protein
MTELHLELDKILLYSINNNYDHAQQGVVFYQALVLHIYTSEYAIDKAYQRMSNRNKEQ